MGEKKISSLHARASPLARAMRGSIVVAAAPPSNEAPSPAKNLRRVHISRTMREEVRHTEPAGSVRVLPGRRKDSKTAHCNLLFFSFLGRALVGGRNVCCCGALLVLGNDFLG